ncbi:unnamed protein product [Polarella glacialis]|uniref:Uncharacterized protein n=1 Tax=Polarella glacialis TaxID=89957 RepID=A0A813ICL0_POLGL|nr:unnamed protein product [Polarella glacialis]
MVCVDAFHSIRIHLLMQSHLGRPRGRRLLFVDDSCLRGRISRVQNAFRSLKIAKQASSLVPFVLQKKVQPISNFSINRSKWKQPFTYSCSFVAVSVLISLFRWSPAKVQGLQP